MKDSKPVWHLFRMAQDGAIDGSCLETISRRKTETEVPVRWSREVSLLQEQWDADVNPIKPMASNGQPPRERDMQRFWTCTSFTQIQFTRAYDWACETDASIL